MPIVLVASYFVDGYTADMTTHNGTNMMSGAQRVTAILRVYKRACRRHWEYYSPSSLLFTVGAGQVGPR